MNFPKLQLLSSPVGSSPHTYKSITWEILLFVRFHHGLTNLFLCFHGLVPNINEATDLSLPQFLSSFVPSSPGSCGSICPSLRMLRLTVCPHHPSAPLLRQLFGQPLWAGSVLDLCPLQCGPQPLLWVNPVPGQVRWFVAFQTHCGL